MLATGGVTAGAGFIGACHSNQWGKCFLVCSFCCTGAGGHHELNRVEGISVQADPFTGSTLIGFGVNSNGNLVTLTRAGVTTPASVMVDVF